MRSMTKRRRRARKERREKERKAKERAKAKQHRRRKKRKLRTSLQIGLMVNQALTSYAHNHLTHSFFPSLFLFSLSFCKHQEPPV